MIRFRPLPMMTLSMVIAVALLCGLGKWQLDRLHWKLGLIAAAETRSHADPVPVETLIGKTSAEIEYTHTATQGEFIPGKRVYLFSQLEDGRIGFQVLEPMHLADGKVLIVDRGFVPQAAKDTPGEAATAPTGEARITGLVRWDQRPGLFTPVPDTKTRVFYVRNIPAIASAMGVSAALPFMIAQDPSGPKGAYPEGGHTLLTFRNDHLQYAITWFSLAGVLLVMYGVYHWKRGLLSFGRNGPTGSP